MKTLAIRLIEACRAIRDADASGTQGALYDAIDKMYVVLDEIEQQETGRDVTA